MERLITVSAECHLGSWTRFSDSAENDRDRDHRLNIRPLTPPPLLSSPSELEVLSTGC